MISLPPPDYQQTVEAVARCDIPPVNIGITYEDELQSDEITISNLGEVNDQKLKCLKNAVHPFYILTIVDDEQRAAYYEFSERMDRPKRKAEARDWVRSQGLEHRLPSYDTAKGLVGFAIALEQACGLKPEVALIPYGPTSLTIRPDFLLNGKFKKSGEVLYCLTQTFAASDAEDFGISFVFIGNEAFRDDEPL